MGVSAELTGNKCGKKLREGKTRRGSKSEDSISTDGEAGVDVRDRRKCSTGGHQGEGTERNQK